MKRKINEKYKQESVFRNDIYRKFEKQFSYIFTNPINLDEEDYVEHDNTEYKDAFDIFFGSLKSDVKFFIGYTGTGKSTFIKHYFGLQTLGVEVSDSQSVIIPITWDGKTVPNHNYKQALNIQICNVLDAATKKVYTEVEEILQNEYDELTSFIESIRPDILQTLSLTDMALAKQHKWSYNQYKLMKCRENTPIEFSSSLFKYAVTQKSNLEIKRIIFIVDDVETISQEKLVHIVNTYFKIFACMHNVHYGPCVKILFSLRPHSYRFLRTSIKHQRISAYGDYLESAKYRLLKNKIPSIKKIFINRFERAIKNTPKPGNQATWDLAKTVFYNIINDFDDNLLFTISEICHLNIRAITDCFQMVLSNRVWCQEIETTNSAFSVRQGDYRFSVVNVIRTLACGENSVYTGSVEVQFNSSSMSDFQERPVLDSSKVFIPNILANVSSSECDVLPALIIHYLSGYFSSSQATPPHTEFITRRTLCDNLLGLLSNCLNATTLDATIDYLFENRIIRKSIISNDDDLSINSLGQEDSLYLTLKGARLLSMFENDSVLLEIFREDIKREYPLEQVDKWYASAYELISTNNRYDLFDDLINLAYEVYYSEDIYQSCARKAPLLFYPDPFPITNKVLKGINNSLTRAQSLEKIHKELLQKRVVSLRNKIQKRCGELGYN